MIISCATRNIRHRHDSLFRLTWKSEFWPRPGNIGLSLGLDLLASASRPKFWPHLASGPKLWPGTRG